MSTMFSRQALIKKPVKYTLNLLKVENAAHIHVVCSHARNISSLVSKNGLKTCRRNMLYSGLPVRYQSSSTKQQTLASRDLIDTIPEPPKPLSELTQSAAEIQNFFGEFHRSTGCNVAPTKELVDSVETFSDGPEIYIRAMEVWKNIEQVPPAAALESTDSPESGSIYSDIISTIYDTVTEVFSSRLLTEDKDTSISTIKDNTHLSSILDSPKIYADDEPAIYKTAVEIWKDDPSAKSEQSSSDITTSTTNSFIAPQSDNIILEATNVAEQLTNGPALNSSPSIEPEVSSEYSSIFDNIPDPPVVPSSIDPSLVEEIAGEPSFASQGLGSWWPSGWVQNALEFLHIDCGLPWWGAVACGTLVIRLLLFPVVVISQRNTAKLNNNLPEMQHLQMKITEARQRGDKLDSARLTGEMVKFMQEKEVNPLKSMIPPLCQAPVFISVFVGLRGMSNLPVESLRTGGILWFTDLTVPDQFYLLPLITSATLFCTLKLGVDGAPSSASQNAVIMKYVMMGLPVIMLPFTVNFPGLLLCYWTSSNFISLIQVGILKIPAVRKYCNIPPLIRHDKEKLPQQQKGFIPSVKDAWTNMKITGELDRRERADKMAFMAAGREPIIKTYKYDPTQVRTKSSSANQEKKKP